MEHVEEEKTKQAIIRKLREAGCRITKQRQLLLDIILEQKCTSCKEIYYRASAMDATIGTATVYRMINTLEEIGAFDRKNLYKISCDIEEETQNTYVIRFEDQTYCRLSKKQYYDVLTKGMEACGYAKGRKIVSAQVKRAE